jgi:hypothetical protein
MAKTISPLEPTSRLPVPEHVSLTCSTVLECVRSVLDARSACIFLRESGSGTLVAVDARGEGAAAFARARIPCDRGVVGLSFTRREAVFSPEPSKCRRSCKAA